MVENAKRAAYIVAGIVCLGLGAVGVALPLLPTTPFILLAAFFFAQSSERMHQWLVDHNVFGPLIADWRRYGAISRNTKIASAISMVAILVISWLLDAPGYVIAIQAIVLGCSALFVLTRPLPPAS